MLPMRYLQHSLLAGIVVSAACLFTTNASAQLSSNPDKFLGNITTRYQVDYGNEPFHTLSASDVIFVKAVPSPLTISPLNP